MEGNREIEEALNFFETREKELSKVYFLCWFLIIPLSLVLIGFAFYFSQIKAPEMYEASLLLTVQHESESARELLIIVDKKLALLRAELKQKNSFSGISGGLMLGLGISGIMVHRTRVKEIQVLRGAISKIRGSS